jgi:two-component system response regulator PilR (NtrC family)
MTTRAAALLVDDEPSILELLEITLGRMGVACVGVGTLSEARNRLAAGDFQLCLTDMRLPDGDGLDLVAHIQRAYPQLPVAVITAHGSIETAIQALKNGAFDFVTKPVDLDALRRLVATALKLSEAPPAGGPLLIGESAAMRQTRATIAKLARSQAPVYVSGESGVGKELVARLIHGLGPRSAQPFVPVNCGAIPQDLMESELFGYKRGSFTGATADRAGLFQAASGGTLFLDEVADLPLHMQVKLLRAIQEKAVRPVGSQVEVPVDVRVLSATHKDLAALVKRGEFRQDLFYRINVIELRVPPLRERREDILPLAQHIIERLALEAAVAKPVLAPPAADALLAYPFPGNVRELENVLERAMTLCEADTIQVRDLSLPNSPVDAATEPGRSQGLAPLLDEVERQQILDALAQTRWNRTAAAKLLGISFRALRYRLAKLGLDRGPGA